MLIALKTVKNCIFFRDLLFEYTEYIFVQLTFISLTVLKCPVSAGALAQVAQRERLRSLLPGDLQKPPGHRPGHPAQGVPAGAEAGPDGPRGPSHLSHSVILY